MAKFEASQSHDHPALYVRWLKYVAPVLNDNLQVCIEKFEHEVQIGF